MTNPECYLSLEGDNIVLRNNDVVLGRVPAHNIEAIVTLGYQGTSPALMGYCTKQNISITYLTPSGRFRARLIGPSRGNVTLRKEQYQQQKFFLAVVTVQIRNRRMLSAFYTQVRTIKN